MASVCVILSHYCQPGLVSGWRGYEGSLRGFWIEKKDEGQQGESTAEFSGISERLATLLEVDFVVGLDLLFNTFNPFVQ